MAWYVTEIAGRGIVAFDAANEDAAKARLADKEFLRDLYVFQSEGRPLWDGVTQINLREALPDEAEAWATSAGHSDEPGDDEGSSYQRVFLVPVVDPSRNGFDDDDDDNDHGD